MSENRMAHLHLENFSGHRSVPCEVFGETPKRYKIILHESCMLPSLRRKKVGDIVHVPKYAITFDGEQS